MNQSFTCFSLASSIARLASCASSSFVRRCSRVLQPQETTHTHHDSLTDGERPHSPHCSPADAFGPLHEFLLHLLLLCGARVRCNLQTLLQESCEKTDTDSRESGWLYHGMLLTLPSAFFCSSFLMKLISSSLTVCSRALLLIFLMAEWY